MKALVISGGGSKGAFACSMAEYLIKTCKQEYKIFIGSMKRPNIGVVMGSANGYGHRSVLYIL